MREFCEERMHEECGCLEQDWVINGIYMTCHLEDDGTGHLTAHGENGEEIDKFVDASTMDGLLSQADKWTFEILEVKDA